MKKRIFLVFAFSLISMVFCCSPRTNPSTLSVSGRDAVPDGETALKIAEALWLPVYGEKIYDEKPFVVKQNKNAWIVEGMIKTEFGGALYIEIQKKDCRILKMYHGK